MRRKDATWSDPAAMRWTEVRTNGFGLVRRQMPAAVGNALPALVAKPLTDRAWRDAKFPAELGRSHSVGHGDHRSPTNLASRALGSCLLAAVCRVRARSVGSWRMSGQSPVLPNSLEYVNAARVAVGAVAAGVALVAPLMLVVGPAGADTPGCVTHAEYRHVHHGMTRGRVHDIFDTSGTSLFENPGVVHNSAREYRMCSAWRAATSDSKVQVQYNNYALHGGPQRVVYKQHY